MPKRIEAEPRFYTPRNPNRKTLGGKVGKVLAAIDGTPMPWQQHGLDVACEIDPATGLFYYREVVWVVLRQAGKTSTSRAKITHRALTTPGKPILYAAQDRNMALRRLEKSFYEPLMESPLAPSVNKLSRKTGAERLLFRNQSEVFIIAAGKKIAAHGEAGLPEAHIDEAFAHRDNRIEAGVNPTMITVTGAQKWVTSAAGDADSKYLWSKVEAGRARTKAGRHGRICYLEYSAPPDADRDDPAVWAATHPAVGYTIDLDNLQTEHDGLAAEEFDRAYLGWWPKAKARPWVIPQGSWDPLALDADDVEWEGTPVWSIDVSPERDWASIGLAAAYPGARAYLEVVAREEGVPWAIPHLRRLRDEFGGNLVVIDGSGSAGSLELDLEDAGFQVRRLSLRNKVDACGALHDDVLDGVVRHGGDPVLDNALASAEKLRSGDAWLFSRGRSLDDISALYAVTLARFGWVESADYDPADSIG